MSAVISVSPVEAVGVTDSKCCYVISTAGCRLTTPECIRHGAAQTTVTIIPPSAKITYRCRKRSTSEKDCYVYCQGDVQQQRSSSSTGIPVEERSEKIGGEVVSGRIFNTDCKLFYGQSPEPLPDILRTLCVVNI